MASALPPLYASKKMFPIFFEKAPLRCAPRLSAFSGQSGARFTQSVFPTYMPREKR